MGEEVTELLLEERKGGGEEGILRGAAAGVLVHSAILVCVMCDGLTCL